MTVLCVNVTHRPRQFAVALTLPQLNITCRRIFLLLKLLAELKSETTVGDSLL